jgi:hypothetical protein
MLVSIAGLTRKATSISVGLPHKHKLFECVSDGNASVTICITAHASKYHAYEGAAIIDDTVTSSCGLVSKRNDTEP